MLRILCSENTGRGAYLHVISLPQLGSIATPLWVAQRGGGGGGMMMFANELTGVYTFFK